MRKLIINIICYFGVIVSGIYSFYLRFANTDMTETRLIVTYWKEYLLSTLILVICLIIACKNDK